MTRRIVIQYQIPSLNKFRGNWREYWNDKTKKAAPALMARLLEHEDRCRNSGTKRHVRIVSYRRRLLDYDNLVGGCKGLIDCLKHQRVIIDDSPKYLDCQFDQELASGGPPELNGKPGTVIILDPKERMP